MVWIGRPFELCKIGVFIPYIIGKTNNTVPLLFLLLYNQPIEIIMIVRFYDIYKSTNNNE